MVKIDANIPIEETPEFKRLKRLKVKKLKKRDEQQISRKRTYSKRRRKKSNCCVFYFLVLIAIIIFIIAMVAKLGIFQIPIFTDVFYVEPQPIRNVAPNNLSQDEIISNLINNVAAEVVIIELTESQLTSLIQDSASLWEEVVINNLQAAILPDKIEFFGHLLNPVDAYLTLSVMPKVNEDKLGFEVLDIRIGNLPLPTKLANFLIEKLLFDPIQNFNKEILKTSTIETIELAEGRVIIKAKL